MTEREAIMTLQAHVVFACEKAGLSKAAVKAVEDALDMAISAMEKQEQDRWIPCKERLPEKDCQCRVTEGDFKFVIDCNWNNHKKQFEAWSYYDDGYIPITNVTAWKPIEEPYEGRRDGNK